MGKCTGEGGVHTFSEGFKACNRNQDNAKAPKGEAKMTEWSSLEKLSQLFKEGKPSNDLTEVGLIFHGFDDSENWWDPYKPCTFGWCKQFAGWWPTSIINAGQRRTFGDSGILFAPTKNRILCSYFEDAGSMGEGDGGKACDAKSGRMFPPNKTKQMLQISMEGTGGYPSYNEALLDSQYFLSNLPGSIAAFVYGISGGWGDPTKAMQAYVGLLKAYNLSEKDVPRE